MNIHNFIGQYLVNLLTFVIFALFQDQLPGIIDGLNVVARKLDVHNKLTNMLLKKSFN